MMKLSRDRCQILLFKKTLSKETIYFPKTNQKSESIGLVAISKLVMKTNI